MRNIAKRRRRSLRVEGLPPRDLLTVWYVNPAGDDRHAGDSTSPWRTLQHAADQVKPGDTVNATPGHYAGFYLATDGTEARRITFVGASAVIDRPNDRTADGINLEGADYVTIRGFEVVGMPRAGIRSVINSNVILEYNVTRDNQRWGIFTGFSEAIVIRNNTTTGSKLEHGIYVSNSADHPQIVANYVTGNNGSGIQLNADLSQGGDGIISDALVARNTIANNGRGGGSAINADGVQYSRFENNVMYNNHASGISLFQGDGAAGSSHNMVINNTIVQPADGRWALNIQGGSTHNQIYNSILLSEHRFRGAIDISEDSRTGLVSDYNAVISRFTTNGGDSILSLAAWQDLTGNDRHSFTANAEALFGKTSIEDASDTRLVAGSPAIDAGRTDVAPSDSFDPATPRVVGTRVDLGAWEYWPLPSGDLNNDGVVSSGDIDYYYHIRRTAPEPQPAWLDVDRNGSLDDHDIEYLVTEVLDSAFGDADFDGTFGSSDLVRVFQMGLFERDNGVDAIWSSGDWNGDQRFTTDDLVWAFQHGTYAG